MAVVSAVTGAGYFVRMAADRGPGGAAKGTRGWKAAVLVLGAVLAMFCLTPETCDDALGYHLSAPADFNKLHKWADIAQETYRYPLLPEGIFGQAMLVRDEQAAALVNLSGGIILAWLLKEVTARMAGAAAGWIAALAMIAGSSMGFHFGQTNQGFFSAGFAFLGVWAWGRSLGAASARPWALVAGTSLGWALCSKYTAIAPVFGIAAWHFIRLPWRMRTESPVFALLAAGLAASSVPFMIKGWLFTGNPVYPFVWGGLGWGGANLDVLNAIGCPGTDFNFRSAGSVLTALRRFFTEEQPLALLALPAMITVRFPARAPFLAAWGGAVAAWAFLSPCLRFMMPLFPALALLAGAGLAEWFGGLRRMKPAPVLLAAVIAAMGTIHAVANADFHKSSFRAAVGLEAAEKYCERILTSYWSVVKETNRIVPSNARILGVGERRGYLFKPLVFNREIEDTPEMLEVVRGARSPGRISVRLRQRGVDYLLLNFVTSEYLTALHGGNYRWSASEIRRHWEWSRRFLSPVWIDSRPDGKNGGYVLYRIRPRPGVPRATMLFLPGAEAAGVKLPGESDDEYCGRMENVERLAPGVVYFGARRAARLLALGRAAEALAVLGRGLKSDYPEREALLCMKGMALQRLGRVREALWAFREAESLKPGERSIVRVREELERKLAGGRAGRSANTAIYPAAVPEGKTE